jgi:hypothetical protein
MPAAAKIGRRIRLQPQRDRGRSRGPFGDRLSAPAASALVDFFATGGCHDLARSEEGARPLLEGTKEGMAAHGWRWAETGARP